MAPVFDPESFLEKAREKAAKRLKKEVLDDAEPEQDFHHLLRTTTGLVKMNNEIWKRCKPNWVKENGYLVLERVHINRVTCSAIDGEGTASVKIQPRKETKDFLAPPEIPKNLKKYLSLETPTEEKDGNGRFDGFPNYMECLEQQVGILREEVAIGFLTAFKEHLEELQVFLGKMDEWLLVTSTNQKFLGGLFQTKVSIPRSFPSSAYCGDCKRYFVNDRRCRYCRSTKQEFLGAEQELYQVNWTGKGTMMLKFDLDDEKDEASLVAMKSFLDTIN